MVRSNGHDPSPDREPGANGSDSSGADAERSEAPSAFEAAFTAGVQAAEIADHVGTLLRIRTDRAELAIRRTVVRLVLGTLIGAGLIAGIAAAGLRVVSGLAGGLAAAFEGRAWVGDLLGGALVLALMAALIGLSVRRRARRDLHKKEAEYEERRLRHAARFGERSREAEESAAH